MSDKKRTRMRHSHSFGVEAPTPLTGALGYRMHSFSHVHVCEVMDGHTHYVGPRSNQARHPFSGGGRE
jgi:hypothetical protein